jgi:predicted extracellular nuclease
VASFNVHNLFNGDGRDGGFPTSRGARTPGEYRRQRRKLVATVQALAPDVAALMEVENDGYGPDSSLAQFVAALNVAGPIRDYRLVDAGHRPGKDRICVALIHRATRVLPEGDPAVLETGPFSRYSRPPLAQAFRRGEGPVFVVVALHLKSKICGRGASAATGPDADHGDGQACWNAVRVESVRSLEAWLEDDPTGTGSDLRLLLGDFNAYGREDPLRTLREAAWIDAFAGSAIEGLHTFVYEAEAGRLDHAMLSKSLAAQLRGAAIWHANSDEPEARGYREGLDEGPYRASDHDPLLLGFDLRDPGLPERVPASRDPVTDPDEPPR